MVLLGALIGCDGSDGGGDDGNTDGNGNGNGGAVNEENFGELFEDKYCEEYEACAGTTDCLLTTDPTPPTGYTPPTTGTCDFDQQAAEDCLDGEWECIAMGPYSFVVPPPACCAICGDPPCPTMGGE